MGLSAALRKLSLATSGPGLYLVFALISSMAVGVAAIAVYLPHAMTSAAIDAAFRTNIEVAEQIKITRGYYTNLVVAKARNSGALVPSYNHKDDPRAIPLPATFVKDISDLLKDRDLTISLVSPYPWPHRADRRMDDFQTAAWNAFQSNPDAVFSRQELRGGRRVLRIAIADRMASEACVACHNSDPASAKKDWKLGDVRGVMDVTKVIEPYIAAAEERSGMVIWSVSLVALGVAVVLILGALHVARRTREKRESEQHVRYLAHHDAMTGALNRPCFLDRVSEMLAQETSKGAIAIHFMDIDRFKEINDRFGHQIGDELIRHVASRVSSVIGHHDLFARLGGDEFVVAQTGVTSESQATDFAAQLLRAASQPVQLDRHRLNISVSLGVAVSSPDNDTCEKLVEAADIALYRAKSAGRAQFMIFESSMRKELHDRADIEKRLGEAVENGEFDLQFQPIYSGQGVLEGFEALLRLPDGHGGVIPPATFIPVAEQIGVIEKIGEWVIERGCAIAGTWPSHLTLAVNLSPALFWHSGKGNRKVGEMVRAALAARGLAADRLEVEITEGLLLEANETVLAELNELKRLGVSLVMDDFGTGHSSLGYFWKLPFDKIKIDRSFVAAAAEARETLTPILKAIIALGRTMNMRVTAEGVETEEQAHFLSELGCDQMQGFLFGRPMPEAAVAAHILAACRSRAHRTRPEERSGDARSAVA